MRRARAIRDLVVIAALLVLAFLAANALESFEQLFEFSREHENWQLDEVFVLLMLSGVGFAVFSWRRWRESDRENRSPVLLGMGRTLPCSSWTSITSRS